MDIKLSTSASEVGKPIVHYWNHCVGAGRANEGLRANWLEHMSFAVENCGFRYVRFHGLLHDDMCVYRKLNGKRVFNWQYIDELFDRLLDIGIRPFIEFGFCPTDMASGSDTVFWWKGNITPPENYNEWSELIEKLVTHWKERYGIEEIRNWYYEVWNEPNLPPFWAGTKSQYYELYKVTVQAVKSVDPKLRVGGPATSNFVPDERFEGEREDLSKHLTFAMDDVDSANWRPVWVENFLTYCASEGLPVDFVSTHPYPTDFALDGHGENHSLKGFSRTVNSTRNDLTLLKSIVKNSAYPNAEIHLTEWSSSPSPRDHSHDRLPAAAFIVKTNIDSIGLVDSLSYWTFTDVFEEGGAGDTIFHGGFGMINSQGIAKPSFHAYRFLHALGDEIVAQLEGAIVTRHSKSDMITALLYHYDEEAIPSAVPIAHTQEEAKRIQSLGKEKKVQLTIKDLPPLCELKVERLDQEHGYAMALWENMDMPEPPNREQTGQLREAAVRTKSDSFFTDSNGELSVTISMQPWSLILIKQI